jgi:hypothetical protein
LLRLDEWQHPGEKSDKNPLPIEKRSKKPQPGTNQDCDPEESASEPYIQGYKSGIADPERLQLTPTDMVACRVYYINMLAAYAKCIYRQIPGRELGSARGLGAPEPILFQGFYH